MGFLTKKRQNELFQRVACNYFLLLFKQLSFYECRSPDKVKETVDVWVLISCYITHLKLPALFFNKYKNMKMVSSTFKEESFCYPISSC